MKDYSITDDIRDQIVMRLTGKVSGEVLQEICDMPLSCNLPSTAPQPWLQRRANYLINALMAYKEARKQEPDFIQTVKDIAHFFACEREDDWIPPMPMTAGTTELRAIESPTKAEMATRFAEKLIVKYHDSHEAWLEEVAEDAVTLAEAIQNRLERKEAQ